LFWKHFVITASENIPHGTAFSWILSLELAKQVAWHLHGAWYFANRGSKTSMASRHWHWRNQHVIRRGNFHVSWWEGKHAVYVQNAECSLAGSEACCVGGKLIQLLPLYIIPFPFSPFIYITAFQNFYFLFVFGEFWWFCLWWWRNMVVGCAWWWRNANWWWQNTSTGNISFL